MTISSPWVNANGDVVHPNAPAGAGGTGPFVQRGPLRSEVDSAAGIPHPQSPAARRILPADAVGVLLAQNEKGSGKKGQATVAAPALRPVTFQEFNNKSPAKYVEAIKSNLMGVHPKGNWPWVNAVELIFTVDAKLAKKMGIKEYRARQKVYSQELWQRELADGQVTPWAKLVSTGEAPDDPDPDLQTITPAIVAYHDAPGFMPGPNPALFKGPADKMTSEKAVYIFLRQNFIGWVDGATGSGKHKQWQQVSDDVKWRSTQALARNIFSSKTPWLAGDGSEIELGHKEGQPK